MNEWEWQLLEDKRPVESISIHGIEVKPGSRVRLQPRPGGDIMDLALTGKTAVIESVEQDYDGKVHVCVVVDDDPGRDIGLMRQPGHRFFFDADEVEPLAQSPASSVTQAPRILVAGIGNIFLGDDAFGVEVLRSLAGREFPANVTVKDFGIRGYDLAYALLDGYDTTILIDACPRGGAAGTLYVVEPDTNNLGDASESLPDAHTMNPLNVLRLARSMAGPMGGPLKKVLLVGCDPGPLGAQEEQMEEQIEEQMEEQIEEGHMRMSEPVTAAVPEAVKLVASLVSRLLGGEPV